MEYIPVCKFWKKGRCNNIACRFLHPDHRSINKSKNSWKNPNTCKSEKSSLDEKAPIKRVQKTQQKSFAIEVNASCKSIQKKLQPLDTTCKSEKSPLVEKTPRNIYCDQDKRALETQLTSEVNASCIGNKRKLCKDWVKDNCTKGDKCENMYSWSCGNGLSMLPRLEGHTKAITGIVLPSGSDKLYCGSKDKSLRVWDCNSGQCRAVVGFDDECGTLVNEGPWILAGLRDMVKAWNLETQTEVIVRGTGGLVNTITMYEDTLFAGMEDGSILSWKSTSKTSFSEVATSLKGHTRSVLSLVVGAKKLFSGSADHTIQVWNPESLECMHVLSGHKGDVTTVLCWDCYLFSGSLDRKIKVWAATESGNIEEVYEHCEDDGVLALCGMHNSEAKPILLCSCKDNGVRLYDLPSFVERGRIFSRRDIQTIQIGPEGLFFTGDAAGLVSVWKLHREPVHKSC